MGLKLFWDGDILFSTSVMIVSMGRLVPQGDRRVITGEGVRGGTLGFRSS